MQVERVRPLYFAYTRVSTEEQADSRNGLEAQRDSIDAEVQRRGWDAEYFSDEGASGKYINGKLREALQLLASGQRDRLIVAKLDRLARSIIHAANIIDAAQAEGCSLVVLDINLDLTTAAGRAMAGTLAVFGQFERELISERTKAALAARKHRGLPVGRKSQAPPGVVRRIVLDRNAGLSYDRIARPGGRGHSQPSWPANMAGVNRAAHLPKRHSRKQIGGELNDLHPSPQHHHQTKR